MSLDSLFASCLVVPFDKITDCDVTEPAGNECFCIKRILSTVNIDTASSGGPEKGPELRIVGLKDPHGFKKLVWAMKRAAPSGYGMNDRGDGTEMASLLREIRDELKENNELLRGMQQQQQTASSVATIPQGDLL